VVGPPAVVPLGAAGQRCRMSTATRDGRSSKRLQYRKKTTTTPAKRLAFWGARGAAGVDEQRRFVSGARPVPLPEGLCNEGPKRQHPCRVRRHPLHNLYGCRKSNLQEYFAGNYKKIRRCWALGKCEPPTNCCMCDRRDRRMLSLHLDGVTKHCSQVAAAMVDTGVLLGRQNRCVLC